MTQQLLSDVRKTNANLGASLVEFEDRSSRNNLIFYEIDDSTSGGYEVTGSKLLNLLSASLGFPVSVNVYHRSRRLDSFVNEI